MTYRDRIAAALANGPLTGREIARATGLSSHIVSQTLDKYPMTFIPLSGERHSRKWGLMDERTEAT